MSSKIDKEFDGLIVEWLSLNDAENNNKYWILNSKKFGKIRFIPSGNKVLIQFEQLEPAKTKLGHMDNFQGKKWNSPIFPEDMSAHDRFKWFSNYMIARLA
jgi:hypothetical protein